MKIRVIKSQFGNANPDYRMIKSYASIIQLNKRNMQTWVLKAAKTSLLTGSDCLNTANQYLIGVSSHLPTTSFNLNNESNPIHLVDNSHGVRKNILTDQLMDIKCFENSQFFNYIPHAGALIQKVEWNTNKFTAKKKIFKHLDDSFKQDFRNETKNSGNYVEFPETNFSFGSVENNVPNFIVEGYACPLLLSYTKGFIFEKHTNPNLFNNLNINLQPLLNKKNETAYRFIRSSNYHSKNFFVQLSKFNKPLVVRDPTKWEIETVQNYSNVKNDLEIYQKAFKKASSPTDIIENCKKGLWALLTKRISHIQDKELLNIIDSNYIEIDEQLGELIKLELQFFQILYRNAGISLDFTRELGGLGTNLNEEILAIERLNYIDLLSL